MSCHDKLEESVGISLLLDFYGELLKSRQRELLELYFSEDLSLSEIASRTGITRQGALDGIRRGEKFLRETEEKLGLVKRFRETGETAATLVRGSPGDGGGGDPTRKTAVGSGPSRGACRSVAITKPFSKSF